MRYYISKKSIEELEKLKEEIELELSENILVRSRAIYFYTKYINLFKSLEIEQEQEFGDLIEAERLKDGLCGVDDED